MLLYTLPSFSVEALFSWLYSIGALTHPWEFKPISFDLLNLVYLQWICSGSTEDLVKVRMSAVDDGRFLPCTHILGVFDIYKKMLYKKTEQIKSKESNGSYQFKRSRVGRGKEEIFDFQLTGNLFWQKRKSNHGSLLFYWSKTFTVHTSG